MGGQQQQTSAKWRSKTGQPASRIEGNGKRSLRRSKLSTRKFSAYKKRRRMYSNNTSTLFSWLKNFQPFVEPKYHHRVNKSKPGINTNVSITTGQIWRPHFTKIIATVMGLITNSAYSSHSIFLHGATNHNAPRPHHYRGFTITLRPTTLSRTPLDERSARLRDLYLTTHNTQKRQITMPPAGFEPTIPASEWPQTDALDRAAWDRLSQH